MANISENLYDWSNTGSSNQPDSGDSATVQADLQAVQAGVRGWLAHKGSDIASSSTTPLADTEGLFHDITGSTTINSFGTTSAGIWKDVKFEGAIPLIHSASLVLLTGANRTTVSGDVGRYVSEGSGTWRELSYMPINTQLTNSGVKFAATQAAAVDANTLDDYEEGTWTPGINSTSPTYIAQNGYYTKIGRAVFFNGLIALSNKGTGTFTAITGLPFTASGSSNDSQQILFRFLALTTSAIAVIGQIVPAGTTIPLNIVTAAATSQNTGIALADISDTTTFSFSGFYTVQ